ncbi:MAG: hypothetical protein K2L48_01690 [Mycoplasmoidaceae bacterium]|nr:hypothetical protein [Mycoplasmoidaceae bacterium]
MLRYLSTKSIFSINDHLNSYLVSVFVSSFELKYGFPLMLNSAILFSRSTTSKLQFEGYLFKLANQ